MKYKLLGLSTYATIQKHVRMLFTNIHKANRIQISINLLRHDAFLHKRACSRRLTVAVAALAPAQPALPAPDDSFFPPLFSTKRLQTSHRLPSLDLSASVSQWPAPCAFHSCMSTLELFSRLMKWKHHVFSFHKEFIQEYTWEHSLGFLILRPTLF